ncbi:MAG: phosphotransferase [Anaerolineae bacterium]|nr:phosphotransferase [Anaerolineae bacterium]
MSDNLDHYLRAWNLSDPQPLAKTATSHVYTVRAGESTAVLKLLTPVGESDEKSGAVALRCFDGQGAVRLLRSDRQAHLLEYVAGTNLVPMVRRGQDEQATIIIAGVLYQLHGAYTGAPPDGLRTLKRWFRSLFRKAEQDPRSIYGRAAPLAEALLAHPREERVLHGDIHHENIRYQAHRGWLAFDPKGLYGERTYDAANALCNPVAMPNLVQNEARLLRNADILARHLDIELSRLLAFVFAYACLSASWSLEDGGSPYLALRVAEIAERHIRLP